MNFVKAKLKIEEINQGETVEFWLDQGEPINNVPRSLKDEGHLIIDLEKVTDYFRIVVKKGGNI